MAVKQTQVSFRCSPEEKDLLTSAADKMGMSIKDFVLLSAQRNMGDEVGSNVGLKWSNEEQEMVINYIRLLAFHHIDQLLEQHTEEEVKTILERARHRYAPLDRSGS